MMAARRALGCVLLLLLNASPLAGLHLPSPSLQRLHRPCASTVRVAPPRLTVDTTHPPHIGRGDAGGKGSTAGKSVGKPSGLVAGGSALAASALLCEGVQVAGTAVLFVIAQQYTHTSSPVQVVSLMISYLQEMGASGYAIFSAAIIFFQVVPVAAAFVLTVSAGAIFGPVKGTAVVVACSTVSASISFLLARLFGRSLVLEAARESPTYQALDDAFTNAGLGTAFMLIFLLRLSPILPFSWANYVFGLSGVSWLAFTLGTLTGCLPAVVAYVSSGSLGAEIAVNGGEANPVLLVLGILATIGAVTVAGNVAGEALKAQGLDLNLQSEGEQAFGGGDGANSGDSLEGGEGRDPKNADDDL